jgi:hypothetical protein
MLIPKMLQQAITIIILLTFDLGILSTGPVDSVNWPPFDLRFQRFVSLSLHPLISYAYAFCAFA